MSLKNESKEVDEELEEIKKIDKEIADGLDVNGLKRVRNKLYKFKDADISVEAYIEKHYILKCINEMLEEEGY